MPAVADEDLVADVDEPPDHHHTLKHADTNFLKSAVRPQTTQKESLLTKALTSSEPNSSKTGSHASPDFFRRQSTRSNTSLASTAGLTSDGGLTSPDRTTTPSPPFPNSTYSNFATYTLGPNVDNIPLPPTIRTADQHHDAVGVSPKANPPANPAPRKSCITFACGGKNDKAVKPAAAADHPKIPTAEVPKRPCTIKFACPGPRPCDKSSDTSPSRSTPSEKTLPSKLAPPLRRTTSRSPSMTRKSRLTVTPPPLAHRDSAAAIRRASRSPEVGRKSKAKYIIAEEKDLESSHFHEFASDQLQEDDWIRKESEGQFRKLTINDTLKKENDIRRLGSEAEEEALEDSDEDEEDDQDQDEEDEDNDDNDDNDSFDDDASDGNETDNEAGFADSDDESDAGEFQFWTPGQAIPSKQPGEPVAYLGQGLRAASLSSIDSLNHMDPSFDGYEGATNGRTKRSRRIKIRPGTPDLPDSTDFVCGTLDEDRPLEEAYVSCMEARKMQRHKQIPQDIDPSFPTSDPEDEEDELDSAPAHDSDDNVWLHGKFEDSGDERVHNRRRSTTAHRKSPGLSPRRLHSPPPPKRRLSPIPPKRRLHSPPPRKHFVDPSATMTINSPATTPTSHATSQAINFIPLASRPGVTFTKSLPRTPNPFCLEYRSSRILAMQGEIDGSDATDGHVRGAIDIVKGLEKKKQRRKEKFCQKYAANRARKGQSERLIPPGKGAERMRELGLLMAGKTGQDPYMLSA
ncbi:hypothetical protein B7463_g4537, partial [Scytalidium lignicola]